VSNIKESLARLPTGQYRKPENTSPFIMAWSKSDGEIGGGAQEGARQQFSASGRVEVKFTGVAASSGDIATYRSLGEGVAARRGDERDQRGRGGARR
jgi:hypothetical protein